MPSPSLPPASITGHAPNSAGFTLTRSAEGLVTLKWHRFGEYAALTHNLIPNAPLADIADLIRTGRQVPHKFFL